MPEEGKRKITLFLDGKKVVVDAGEARKEVWSHALAKGVFLRCVPSMIRVASELAYGFSFCRQKWSGPQEVLSFERPPGKLHSGAEV